MGSSELVEQLNKQLEDITRELEHSRAVRIGHERDAATARAEQQREADLKAQQATLPGMTEAAYRAKLLEYAQAGDTAGSHALQAQVVDGTLLVPGINNGLEPPQELVQEHPRTRGAVEQEPQAPKPEQPAVQRPAASMTRTQYKAELQKYADAGQWQEMQAFQARVVSGAQQVQGVNMQ